MMMTTKNNPHSAFTIVELIVAISVIAILAGIVLVSYGSWRTSVATSSLKSDLAHAASAMESSRSFGNAYPLTLPTTFTTSAGNTLVLTNPSTSSFCIDGTTTQSGSILYYIDNASQGNGATSGTCATRVAQSVPTAVSTASFTTGATSIVVSWTPTAALITDEYTVQCALDPGFINGLMEQIAYGGDTVTTTFNSAKAVSTYYCRVKAVNDNGQSDWFNTAAGNT